MEEIAIGSGVFWYPAQRLNALAEAKTPGLLTAFLVDTLFDRETLAISNLNGGGFCGYKQLCPKIVQAITGMLQHSSLVLPNFALEAINLFFIYQKTSEYRALNDITCNCKNYHNRNLHYLQFLSNQSILYIESEFNNNRVHCT